MEHFELLKKRQIKSREIKSKIEGSKSVFARDAAVRILQRRLRLFLCQIRSLVMNPSIRLKDRINVLERISQRHMIYLRKVDLEAATEDRRKFIKFYAPKSWRPAKYQK